MEKQQQAPVTQEEKDKQTKMSKWKCSYGKSCECNSDVEKSECSLAYIAKKMNKEEQKKLVSKLLKASNDIHKKRLGQANYIHLSEKFIQHRADEEGVTFDEMAKIIEEELKYNENNN